MSQENSRIIFGMLLVFVLGFALLFLHGKSVQGSARGFTLYANFSKADGLMNNAPVRIAGMRVGEVSDQKFGSNYRVRTRLSFDYPMELPIDSSVVIETDGLMGVKYLEIVPGADDEMMISGEEFAYTQDALILGELLEKMLGFLREKKKDVIDITGVEED